MVNGVVVVSVVTRAGREAQGTSRHEGPDMRYISSAFLLESWWVLRDSLAHVQTLVHVVWTPAHVSCPWAGEVVAS